MIRYCVFVGMRISDVLDVLGVVAPVAGRPAGWAQSWKRESSPLMLITPSSPKLPPPHDAQESTSQSLYRNRLQAQPWKGVRKIASALGSPASFEEALRSTGFTAGAARAL